MYCQVSHAVLWALQRCLPGLQTLVVREDVLGGVGSNGVAAVAGLSRLTSLAVTVAAGTDVSVLGGLTNLR